VALQVHNVRTRRKEPLVPRDPRRVGLYVCGLTVYDHVHIGHARTYTAFEVVRRWLEHRFGAVHHVMNVTDVDDKIIARALERGVSPRAHAAEWDRTCRTELETLGIRLPSGADYPHVTTSIGDILRFVAAIAANGFAYTTQEGNVYFDVPRYDAHAAVHLKDRDGRPCGYGSLSNRDYRAMAAGTRKEVEGDKRHPADFALWKAAGPGDHPDANWDPGAEAPDAAAALPGIRRGRPGWHIECSLMSTRALGDTFDIHGGGQDLVFPHHENEVAQSQAKTGQAPFVETWMHTGFLNVEGEKMSKSLGNFITLVDAIADLRREGHGPAALRLYFVQTHYRSRIDFQRKGLLEAAKALAGLEATRQFLHGLASRGGIGCADMDVPLREAAERLEAGFAAAMDDDVHTPGALAALFDFQREANRLLDTQSTDRPIGAAAARQALAAYEACARILTLFEDATKGTPEDAGIPAALAAAARRAQVPVDGATGEAAVMEAFLAARQAARQARDWGRSDAIRAVAREAGYLIEDTPAGQRWRRL
jgi:cysteinyl-tRNA synthetase